MKLLRIYQSALVLSALLYAAYWFASWSFHILEPDLQQLLGAHGYGRLAPSWVPHTLFVVTMAGYVGMYFFQRFFRDLFVLAFIVGLGFAPVNGVAVQTGVEVLAYDLSMFLRGAVLALAYFTSLDQHFVKPAATRGITSNGRARD